MKQRCKHHPGETATWYCAEDGIHFCDDCVASEDGHDGERARCFLCNRPLQVAHRGGTDGPFWHHLSRFIEYPLARDPVLLAAALALAAVALPSGWPGVALAVALGLPLGVAGKAVLDHTVSGQRGTPSPRALLEPATVRNGVQLWLVFAGAGVALALAYHHFGMLAGSGMVVLAWLLLPALLVRTDMDDNLLVPLLAPTRLLSVVTAFGLDYAVAALFLAGGFLALSLVLGIASELPAWAAAPIATLAVAWFFLLACRLLGHLVGQHREKLGYDGGMDVARQRQRARRPEAERREAVLLREGRFRRVTEDYRRQLEKQPESLALHERYQRLLQALGQRADQLAHGGAYLDLLLRNQQDYRATAMLRHYRRLDPAFRPATAQATWELAQLLARNGEAKLAVSLLADQHKRTPTWPGLARAYLFIAGILKREFGLDAKAEQYLRFVEGRYRDQASQELAKACREELFGVRNT